MTSATAGPAQVDQGLPAADIDHGEVAGQRVAQPEFEGGWRRAFDEQQPFVRPQPVGRGAPIGDKGARRRRQGKAQHPFYPLGKRALIGVIGAADTGSLRFVESDRRPAHRRPGHSPRPRHRAAPCRRAAARR